MLARMYQRFLSDNGFTYTVEEVTEMEHPEQISGVEVWDVHRHGGERVEAATKLADELSEEFASQKAD